MVIGDAAHAMSAIAGQGGGQSVEDAATLAICLELAGKSRVKLALQVVEKIRYQRTSIIQDSGNAVYSQMRDPDWEAIQKNPSMMKFPRPDWIFGYDAHRDVYEQFPAAMRAVRDSTGYRPRNIPSDSKYQVVHDYKKPVAA